MRESGNRFFAHITRQQKSQSGMRSRLIAPRSSRAQSRAEMKKCQRVCKPGFVQRRQPCGLSACATIPLGGGSLRPSSNQPGRPGRNTPYAVPIRSCSRWGLPCRLPLPEPRCALTAPFHCHASEEFWAEARRDLLSVALSLGSPPPGITRHRYSVEPGLSSSHRSKTRPPNPLAGCT
jgi:hypothetical protein